LVGSRILQILGFGLGFWGPQLLDQLLIYIEGLVHQLPNPSVFEVVQIVRGREYVRVPFPAKSVEEERRV
jgi:hypothetical protein